MTEHKLRAAGAAFTLPNISRVDPTGTGGAGYGFCSCGGHSAWLTSGRQRKAWFADHKAAMERLEDDSQFTVVDDAEWDEKSAKPTQTDDEIQAELDAQAAARAKQIQDDEDERVAYYNMEEAEGELANDILEQLETDGHATVEDGDVVPENDGHTWAERTLRGNYSIELAPIFQKMADATDSLLLKTSIKVDSAVLRHASVEGPRAAVEAFLERFDAFNGQWPYDLKVWQKTTVADRRGLTDMAKFNAHREYIRELAGKAGVR